jgi:hypothetical protein
MGVFGQPFADGLAVSKKVLHDRKEGSTLARTDDLRRSISFSQAIVPAGVFWRLPTRRLMRQPIKDKPLVSCDFFPLFNPRIARISGHNSIVFSNQTRGFYDVAYVGRRGLDTGT